MRHVRVWMAIGIVGVLLAPAAAAAQGPTVDQLLLRIFGSEGTEPYYETADFAARLTLNVRGMRLAATPPGAFPPGPPPPARSRSSSWTCRCCCVHFPASCAG